MSIGPGLHLDQEDNITTHSDNVNPSLVISDDGSDIGCQTQTMQQTTLTDSHVPTQFKATKPGRRTQAIPGASVKKA